MKKGVRQKLMEIRKLRRQQRDEMLSLAQPLKDNLDLLDRVLKGEVNEQQFINHSFAVNTYLKKFNVLQVADELEKRNPYPKDVFLDKSANDWQKFRNALSKAGLVQDGYMGTFGRSVWANCIDEMRKVVKDE